MCAHCSKESCCIFRQFQAISSVTDRPIILYNIPARTGVDIELPTVISLAADPHFAAIKQCGGNVSQITNLINHTPLKVLRGDDALIFTTLCLGGHGAITAAAHIRPDLYVHVFELMQARQIEQARAVFNTLLPLIRLLFSEPNPGPVKAALALQGRILEELHLPMMPMSKIGKEQLAGSLEQVMALPTWPTLSAHVGSGKQAAHLVNASPGVPSFVGGGVTSVESKNHTELRLLSAAA
jgi:4-hydroxy-tetrahydrodipicolinate synthase